MTTNREDLIAETIAFLNERMPCQVTTLQAHSPNDAVGIAKVIASVNVGYIGAPEFESAIADLSELQDFGVEDIAREVVLAEGLSDAEKLGYNTRDYSCDLTF